MSSRIRLAIFICFALLFVVTAPTVVLLTAGYRYNWKKQRLEKTGVIQLDSRPRGARVSLNGVPQKKTTPATLSRVLPEDYRVTLDKQGYYPWEKTLEVPSGGAAFARDIMLYRDSLPEIRYARRIVSSEWNADGTAAILFIDEGGDKRSVESYLADGTVRLLDSVPVPYLHAAAAWSPDGKSFLLDLETSSGREIAVGSMNDVADTPRRLSKISRGDGIAHWSVDSRTVTIGGKGVVRTISAETGALTEIRVPASTSDALLDGDALLLMSPRGKGSEILSMRLDTGETATIFSLESGRFTIVAKEGEHLAVRDAATSQLAFLTKSAYPLYTVATRYRWQRKGGQGDLLLWNDFQIEIQSPEGTSKLVTRIGTPIAAAQWDPREQDIIYSTDTSVVAIELDDRDVRNAFELARATRISGFAVTHDGSSLLFAGDIGDTSGVFEKTLE